MEYSKDQIIQFTINILSGINVPAVKASEIGVPIENAIKNLYVIQKIMEMEENQRKVAQEEACETDEIDFGKDVGEDGNGETDAE